MKRILFYIAVFCGTALFCGCTTDAYYRGANVSPVVNVLDGGFDWNGIDTIKTGVKSLRRTLVIPLEVYDANSNINFLGCFADGGSAVIKGLGAETDMAAWSVGQSDIRCVVEYTPTEEGVASGNGFMVGFQ